MCSAATPTSLRHRLHAPGEYERSQDVMYTLLTKSKCEQRNKLVSGIVRMLDDITKHPVILQINTYLQSSDCKRNRYYVECALLLAALVFEPNFLQHILALPNTCSSTVSQYVMTVVQPALDNYINGGLTLEEFVSSMAHAYVVL